MATTADAAVAGAVPAKSVGLVSPAAKSPSRDRDDSESNCSNSSGRDRSVSMTMPPNAPPAKKQRSSDDEFEQATPPPTPGIGVDHTAAPLQSSDEAAGGQDVATAASATQFAVDNDDDDDDDDDDASDSSVTEDSFMSWLLEQKSQGVGAGQMLDVLGLGVSDGVAVDDDELWEAMLSMGIRLIRPSVPARLKLDSVNTMDDVVRLLRTSSKIVVLAGAGISVSCGIPDFRSENGIYSRLGEYNLPDPQCMFDIEFFRSNPRPFFAFAKELFPKANGFTFVPSRSHYFLKLLQDQGKLLRIYSQNIDMLEHAAGISHERSILCHGSFATATCLSCKTTYPNDAIRDDVSMQQVPMCKVCNAEDGIIKPDIVFFGESLPRRFHDSLKADEGEADLVIVMGSSLKVNPVRSIVGRFRKETPMILINREPVGRPHRFDVELLGFSDDIVEELCRRLEWEIPRPDPVLLGQSNLSDSALQARVNAPSNESAPTQFEFVPPSRYMFDGAKPNYVSSDDEDGDSSSSSSERADELAEAEAAAADAMTAENHGEREKAEVENGGDEDQDELMGSGNELLGRTSFEEEN